MDIPRPPRRSRRLGSVATDAAIIILIDITLLVVDIVVSFGKLNVRLVVDFFKLPEERWIDFKYVIRDHRFGHMRHMNLHHWSSVQDFPRGILNTHIHSIISLYIIINIYRYSIHLVYSTEQELNSNPISASQHQPI
jgi:hypothetical protein